MGRFVMEILTQIAVFCGSLLTVGAFFKALSRTKWFRRLWYRNFSQPFTDWLSAAIKEGGRAAAVSFHEDIVEGVLTNIRDDIAEIRKELTVNGGTSLKDAVQEVRQKAALFEEFMRGPGWVTSDHAPNED